MANPLILGISATEQDLLYKKLSIYNQKEASFKEAGAYSMVLSRTDYPRYSLWVYSPLPERQSIFYIFGLNEDVYEALRIASTLCYYPLCPLLLMEYNAKRMQNRGNDIISFDRYHGHYLHEILRIDPGYLAWIALKFTPRIPKQERFIQVAGVYRPVYIDILQREARQPSAGHFLDKKGGKVENLVLTVLNARLEDDPYEAQVKSTTPYFYIRRTLRLRDASDNLVIFRVNLHTTGRYSCQLPTMEHTYRVDGTVYIASARTAVTYTTGRNKWM